MNSYVGVIKNEHLQFSVRDNEYGVEWCKGEWY